MHCLFLPGRTAVSAVCAWIAFFLSACNSLLGPGELASLDAGKRRWAARPFADYSFEMRESCFCPYYGWVRATVVDGVVVAVEAADPDTGLLPDPATWPTIDALFTQIQRLALHAEGPYRDLAVRFDAALGYPMWIEARSAKGVYDAGFSIEVRAVSGR